MFSEELSYNAGRKKADENRARRKQIQQHHQVQRQRQQQLQQSKASTAAGSLNHVTNNPNISTDLAAARTLLSPNDSDITVVQVRTIATEESGQSTALECNNIVASNPTTGFKSCLSIPTTSNIVSGVSQLSAVERAKHERNIRAEKAVQEKSAIMIQAIYRQHRTYTKSYDIIVQQMHNQISDLEKLNTILLSKKPQSAYIKHTSVVPKAAFHPPTRVTTSFVRQLFFVCRHYDTMTSNGSTKKGFGYFFDESNYKLSSMHIKFLQQVVDYTLLPSFLANNESSQNETANVFDCWIQNEHIYGVIRIRKLLRLIALSVIHPDINLQQLETFVTFLKIALSAVPPEPDTITSTIKMDKSTILASSNIRSHQICRSYLFPWSSLAHCSTLAWQIPMQAQLLIPSTSSSNGRLVDRQVDVNSGTEVKDHDINTFDWILLVRHYLLFYQRRKYTQSLTGFQRRRNEISVETGRPIPSDADTKREESFLPFEKIRASYLLHFLMDEACSSRNTSLQSKIVTHILTIPLLSWRIHVASSPQQRKQTTLPHQNDSSHSPRDIVEFLTSTSGDSFPVLIQFVQAYLNAISIDRSDTRGYRRIDLFLPTADVPLAICPVTPTQCLLANLVQFGRLCPSLTPSLCTSKSNPFSFRLASFYFDFVSLLLDSVPLSTYRTNESSAVEWIDDGHGHFKPIILSNIVLDQCKGILVDSYVRKLVLLATNDEKLLNEVEVAMKSKTSHDIRHEKDIQDEANGSMTSAAALAASAVRADQNRSIWNSSKWAKKIAKSVSGLLNTSIVGVQIDRKDSSLATDRKAVLSHRTEVSKSLLSLPIQVAEAFTLDLLFSLCRMYAILIARWGGNGGIDLVHGPRTTTKLSVEKKKDRTSGREGSANGQKEMRKEALQDEATSRPEQFVVSLLNIFGFSTPIVRILWILIQQDDHGHDTMAACLRSITDADKGRIPVQSQSIMPVCDKYPILSPNRFATNNDCGVLLFMFLCTLSHVLIITDDVEINDMDKPIPLHQIRRCVLLLKKVLYRASCVDNLATTAEAAAMFPPNYFGRSLLLAAAKAMKDLYDRSSRKPFCLPSMWTIPKLLEKEVGKCKSFTDYQSLLASTPVLKVCPFLVSFKLRLKLFERIITTNRIEIQGENSANPFHTNQLKPGIPIRIRRGHSLEDGLVLMNNFSPQMFRQRFQINYYNDAGARETGIDAGGLFKDFWTDLCDLAFNPSFALFRLTEDGAFGNCLYPSPASATVHGATDHVVLFEFLGRILGKALYEGITISPRFAHFFLSFIRGDYNFLHMLPDLSTVDTQLYNNLMFLKNYDGDCSELCLTFTVTNDEFGGNKEVALIPNGANVDVTNENKQLYIGLVAKYYVYDRVKEQSEAFTKGLRDVLDRSWLLLFNEPELQVLISGVAEGNLDIDDMKAHVQYVGGYSSVDLTICRFWNVVGSMTPQQQSKLLRFVTGCERPPPLGFGSMNPPFTIQRVGTGGGLLRDGNRLPTSSTCFNILKLPCYGSEKVLKDRLIYAIESGAGFELS